MAGRSEARLTELGITLAEPAVPQADHVPWVRTGNRVFGDLRRHARFAAVAACLPPDSAVEVDAVLEIR